MTASNIVAVENLSAGDILDRIPSVVPAPTTKMNVVRGFVRRVRVARKYVYVTLGDYTIAKFEKGTQVTLRSMRLKSDEISGTKVCAVCGNETTKYAWHFRLGVAICPTCPLTNVRGEDVSTHAMRFVNWNK